MLNEVGQLLKNTIENKLGEDILLFDITSINPFLEYSLICSARNEAHARSIYHEIVQESENKGWIISYKENTKGSGWYLLSVEGILIHIFFEEKREYYRLEELWKDLRL